MPDIALIKIRIKGSLFFTTLYISSAVKKIEASILCGADITLEQNNCIATAARSAQLVGFSAQRDACT